MARFQRDAEIVPFPRDLLDEAVRALLDAAAEAPVTERGVEFGDEVIDDLRLVEGRHLAAGARYRAEDDALVVEAHVPAWNPVGESRLEVTGEADGHVVHLQVTLRMSGRRLHTIRVTGDYQGPKPFRRLRRARWECELRADEWWSSLGAKSSPISLRVVHPFAFVDLGIARRKDKRGRWKVRTVTRFGGRSLTRPLAAVGLAVMRRRVRSMLDEGIASVVSAWNAEVPAIAKRGMQERVEFEHRITLTSVSREWVEAYVGALHKGIEGLHFKKGRLVKSSKESFSVRLLKGKHIRPGTRYRVAFAPDDGEEVEPLDLHVASWEFDGPSRIEFNSPEDVQAGWIEVDSARRPAAVRAGFTGAFESHSSVRARAEADLAHWWSTGHLLTGTAEIPVGEATLAVERTAEQDGEWTVDVTGTVEGRAWGRHLVAVGWVLFGTSMRRSFQKNADAIAEKWNGAIPRAGTAEQAAEATLRAVLDR